MKKKLKYIWITLLVLLVVIQFIQPSMNASPAYSGHRITDVYQVPKDVEPLLENACYDCHSNNSKPMWYMRVQPIGWWINNHISEGKEEINFDEFGTYSLRRQYRKFEEIIDQVKEKEMPLSSYTWIHDDADLSDAERVKITNWATDMRTMMEANYPKDSLVRKQ